MGLHLNWELRLPASTSDDTVCATLAALRLFALQLGFEDVSPLLAVSSAEAPESGGWPETLRFWAALIAEPYDEDSPPLRGDPATAHGFFVQPGEGCETASFGFLRRADDDGQQHEWFWHCSCKTQYASVVSDDHLVRCHTSLVRVLERAIELGADVVVRDETHYWETRDESRLIAEVQAMNRLVARIAGKIGDTLGPAGDVHAPIFAHRRFERLEVGDDE